MENDDKKYEDVIKALKGLQEVKAPANFEADLQRRINSEKFLKEEKKSFWQNIFVPSRLIPSFGLIATAIVIFFVIETNSEEMDNPFLIEPRVREDVLTVTEFEQVEKKQEDLSRQKPLKKESPVIDQKNNDGQLKSSELKSSGDELIAGKEESKINDVLTEENDDVSEKGFISGANSAVESTLTTVTGSTQPKASTEANAEMVQGQSITKDELNFRQIQLNEEQQRTVNELKSQVQSLNKSKKTQK